MTPPADLPDSTDAKALAKRIVNEVAAATCTALYLAFPESEHHDAITCEVCKVQAEAAIRPLAALAEQGEADKARLDWIEATLGGDIEEIDLERMTRGGACVAAYTAGLMECREYGEGASVRLALDAARSAGGHDAEK